MVKNSFVFNHRGHREHREKNVYGRKIKRQKAKGKRQKAKGDKEQILCQNKSNSEPK